MARAYFHLAFFCWFLFYIRHRAGQADNHLHLPGRPQLQVRSSHHNSTANVFPRIIFAQYSIHQGPKGRKSFKHLEEVSPPKGNYPEKLQFRINKASCIFYRGFLSPICRGEFVIYQAVEREGLSTRWFWNSWAKVNLVFNFKVQKNREVERITIKLQRDITNLKPGYEGMWSCLLCYTFPCSWLHRQFLRREKAKSVWEGWKYNQIFLAGSTKGGKAVSLIKIWTSASTSAFHNVTRYSKIWYSFIAGCSTRRAVSNGFTLASVLAAAC